MGTRGSLAGVRICKGLATMLSGIALGLVITTTGCGSAGSGTPPGNTAAAGPPGSTSADKANEATPPPPAPAPAQAAGGAGAPPPTKAQPTSTLPAFPWPPPRYSAFATIDRAWVAPGASPTLSTAAGRLEHAFDAAGYGERSYYRIPGGFALVSRIEQIQPDGTPAKPPARWAVDTPTVREGFIDYLRALFNAPPGFYRLIVFTITDQDFAASERPPTSSEARNWISGGSLRLPESVGALPYTAQHYTTALIFEFERRADQSEARVIAPGNSPGRVHLEKAGLWQALAAR